LLGLLCRDASAGSGGTSCENAGCEGDTCLGGVAILLAVLVLVVVVVVAEDVLLDQSAGLEDYVL
jgi:hypothetical protein